ncbi:ATP-binding cassette domain-containing protein [Arthrobacter sp. 35W]|uniref:ATP-binding cassette domain-containing protein n=1 Tax=Arthrobacter sp. 35W TaxID=1132441 RepID=UPI0003F95C85|nr:ATP-binding cassette domain-containing protein [Arthrobacter sp. 35W]
MQPVIHADNLELSSTRGTVYGPLTFEIGPGLTLVCGPSGSGRTSLLLSMAGRMKPSSGTLDVLGRNVPAQLRSVQKATAIAGFEGIDGLEDSVTVGAALRERRAWLSPWYAIVGKLTDPEVAEVCAPVFGSARIPHADTVIWDLDETQAFLLRITLAMMSAPEILFLDDIDQVHSRAAREVIWHRLAALAAHGTAVVVAASSQDTDLWTALDTQPTTLLIDTEMS